MGQSFLVDDNIAKKIIRFLDIKEKEPLLEIGPGHGSLTKHLIKISKNYLAIELDKNIVEKLKHQYGNNIKIINKDFLELNFSTDIKGVFNSDKKIKIIGNIPYNITTEILFRLFELKDKLDLAVMMVQKEVAQRLTARPNTKDYGILSIQTQLNSEPSNLFNVPPTAFFPKPKVYSSVIRLEFSNDKYQLHNKGLFNRIVKESFGQRRKTMRNSLKKLFADLNIDTSFIIFDLSRRPENVSVEEFVNFSIEISDLKKVPND